MPTDKQLEANRENAQHSTGPKTEEGKAKVSHNALKTGLTGRTVLLPSDDATAYQSHVARVFKQFLPATESVPTKDESLHNDSDLQLHRLAQSLADALWRLDRIPSLEAGIYAIGRRALAHEFADESDEGVRNALIEAQVFLTYRRDLNNLSIQETRLRRQYEREEGELKRLLDERAAAAKKQKEHQKQCLRQAVQHYKTAQDCGMDFDPAEIGFEFSIEQVKAYVLQQEIDATIANGRYYEWKAKGRFPRAA